MAYSNFGAQFQAFVTRVAEVCKTFVTTDALTAALSNKLDKTGTAASATKATQDASGNVITTSYGASLEGNGTNTVTLKSKSGAELSKITVNNVAKATSADSATSATQLANSRNISLTGDVSGSTGFNGTGDASISVTLANSGVSAGTSGPSSNVTIGQGSSGSFVVPYFTTDAKGRVTSRGTRTITITTGGGGLENIGAKTYLIGETTPDKTGTQSMCNVSIISASSSLTANTTIVGTSGSGSYYSSYAALSRDAYGRLSAVGCYRVKLSNCTCGGECDGN